MLFMLFFLFDAALLNCCSAEEKWWETAVFYQIYPRSFMDNDGDGVGDIKGIISKLGYIKDLGVDAVWLSPIFKSPMYDFGYDISDYYAIQEEYGTMEDFEFLVDKAKDIDLKIVLDFVPNHTSNESFWFQEALKGNPKYVDYFIWEDGRFDENNKRHPPNNWVSHFRGSAWEYREELGKYYLHQFVVGQPDLNYRNPDVVQEMKNVMRFWLNKGVAGFRVDAVNTLYEVDKELFSGKFPDEPLSGKTDDPTDHGYLDHIYTLDQNETYYMVYEWRKVLDEFESFPRVMMTEAYTSIENVVKYFGTNKQQGSNLPFYFDIIEKITPSSTAEDFKVVLDRFLENKPPGKRTHWVVGNHDKSRVASRLTPAMVDGINMITLLTPDIAITYMGEEIGMVNGNVSWEDTVDPAGCNTHDPVNYVKTSRDPQRTPFQWSAAKNAGFSTANKTWLPVAEGYEKLNVQLQQTKTKSHLKIYRQLTELRRKNAFKDGSYQSWAFNDDILIFKRSKDDETYFVLVNLHDNNYNVNLETTGIARGDLVVEISGTTSNKEKGEVFKSYAVPMTRNECVVFKA